MRLVDPWSDEARRRAAVRHLHPERYEKDPPSFLIFMVVVGMIVGYIITVIMAF